LKARKHKAAGKKTPKKMINALIAICVIAVIAALVLAPSINLFGGNPENGGQNQQNQSGVQIVSITINNKAYSTTAVSLSVGDLIKWTNQESLRHFVQIVGVTASPALQNGQSWNYTFSTAGVYQFRDMDWPYMKGTVTVS